MARVKINFPQLGGSYKDGEIGEVRFVESTASASLGAYIDAADVDEAVWLRLALTAQTTGGITIKAGNGPRSGLGDFVSALPSSAGGQTPIVIIGPLETARFKWLSGTTDYKGRIHVDFTHKTAGTISGFKFR